MEHRSPGTGRGSWDVLVKYLAQYYKVLLWDRHNSPGSSDLYLTETRDTLPPMPMTSVN